MFSALDVPSYALRTEELKFLHHIPSLYVQDSLVILANGASSYNPAFLPLTYPRTPCGQKNPSFCIKSPRYTCKIPSLYVQTVHLRITPRFLPLTYPRTSCGQKNSSFCIRSPRYRGKGVLARDYEFTHLTLNESSIISRATNRQRSVALSITFGAYYEN